MRELNFTELQAVSGSGMPANVMIGMGFTGLAVSIPVIVGGAVFGFDTWGLGYVAMAAGIVGAAISGGMALMGIISNIAALFNQGNTDPELPVLTV
ncbi:hypothetical protein [Mixta theicola]|uniref:hypothetical protein n=1 Tax=Mixta theicola TaxID=1458355 RepID=UPI0019819479|nr:hypothetical protein [Mixta theicola]GLR08610.1 hypothetical protein GCM10007905_13290 [Mixta theicola]